MEIDHIGIAVENLRDSLEMYENLLGIKPFHSEIIPDQKVRVCFLKVGEQKLELIEATSESSPIFRFIQKRGPGIHHIAYRVEDIRDALAQFKQKGAILIDEHPRRGAMNKWIAFIHPKSTHGVLTELCQPIESEEE